MTHRSHAGLGRVLDDLGSTLLELVHGSPDQPGAIGGVVIHDPIEQPVLSEHALVLGVGIDDPVRIVALLRSLGRAHASALVLRAPVPRTAELAVAAEESGVAVLALARGASWNQLAALLRSLLAEGDVGDAGPETLGGLPSGDLFAVANAVAALIDAPITIEDRSSRVLAFSGRQDEADPSRVETILGRQVPERYARLLTESGVFRELYTSDDPVHVEPIAGVADFVVPRVAVRVCAGDEFLGSIWAAIPGPQTAIVVGPSGEEIYTDEHGRVKVMFHWDRYCKADENSSCWIRVAQVWGGKQWGAIYTPRIGQEVIVEFLEGDPDKPLITGRVYNGTNKPPYPLPDMATISTLKSSSSKGGAGFNEIRFEDKKDEEQLFIHGQKNMDVRVKNDAFEWIGNDRHLVIVNDQLEHVKNNRSEIVDQDHKEKIGKDRHLKVVGKEAKEVGDSLSLTVKGDVIEVFKAKHSEETTGDYYLKADNICIEGLTNITIKVGQTSIALESDGISIETQGEIKVKSMKDTSFKSDTGNFKAEATQNVELKGTAGAKLEGTAQVEVKGATATLKGDAMTTIKGGMVMIN
jgi:hypothetical protein